jgi:hypothetical protein
MSEELPLSLPFGGRLFYLFSGVPEPALNTRLLFERLRLPFLSCQADGGLSLSTPATRGASSALREIDFTASPHSTGSYQGTG